MERGEGTFVTIWSSHPRKRSPYVESQWRRWRPPLPSRAGVVWYEKARTEIAEEIRERRIRVRLENT